MRKTVLLLLATTLAAPAAGQQQPGAVGGPAVAPAGQALPLESSNIRVEGHVVEPKALAPDVTKLRVPQGYEIAIFAEGLGNARMLATRKDGTVYVTRRSEGDVVMLRDNDGDGRADVRQVVARRPMMHGIALDGDTAYLMTVKEIFTAPINADGTFGALTPIVDDLPEGGQHPNRTLGLAPDGALYASIGSTCNACGETNPENATLIEVAKDGTRRSIFARGLRNTIGFDWHPRTGELWGLDHGIDWLGDTVQQEELNRLVHRRQYGWPYVYGTGGHNPQDEPPGGLTAEQWAEMSEPAVIGYDAHAAPMQMAFNTGTMFPAAEQGNGFAAMRGSWNRAQPSGYEVVRIRFDEAGEPQGFEPFVTGFLQTAPGGGPGHLGRPTGLAFASDGALLFTDDVNGVVYRVTYTGEGAGQPLQRTAAKPAPSGDMTLAMARDETAAEAALNVSSAAFQPNGAMPMPYSAYGQNISPPLRWSAGPEGTKSYAIIMEDPKASGGRLVVHWTAWNIPAGTTELGEALPGDAQLSEPKGMRQGLSNYGAVGYRGPRPPIGDTPHPYHFQIFALDTVLELLPAADKEALLAAMEGHVLAEGELVGTYGQATPPAK